MTHQIITIQPAYLLRSTTRVFILDVDRAVDFASWLQAQGFTVEMSEGPYALCGEAEEAAAAALVSMYGRCTA